MAFGVQSIDGEVLKNNVVALAKAAKVFKVRRPHITTVETESFSGHTYAELWPFSLATRSSSAPRSTLGTTRTCAMRCCDRPQKSGGRGTFDRGVQSHVSLSAMKEGGYEIYMVADASGATSRMLRSTQWIAWSRRARCR